jgi:hypothetical protein
VNHVRHFSSGWKSGGLSNTVWYLMITMHPVVTVRDVRSNRILTVLALWSMGLAVGVCVTLCRKNLAPFDVALCAEWR